LDFGRCVRALALGERLLPVPRPEHLAAMKVQAMKSDPGRTLREMADIQFLPGGAPFELTAARREGPGAGPRRRVADGRESKP
jgi:hypothetical protein